MAQATVPSGEQTLPSVKLDLSYSLITLGSTTLWGVLSGWLFYFYLPPEGEGTTLVPAALFGVALFANRAIDAVIDPPIGYLSDHTRSRWGRRLPYMAASALPLLIFFVLLWTPPVKGESIWNLVYLAVILELYNIAYSFLHIPHDALLPELALTDRHRVRLSTWSAGFQTLAMILSAMAGWLIQLQGYVRMALLYALAMLPFFYLPFLVLRERPERQIAAQDRLGFRQSFVATLRNRAFLIYTATWALYWAMMTIIPAVMPYIVTEICLLPTAETVYFYVLSVPVSVLCYPLVMWLAGRLGKWRVFTGSLLASGLALIALLFVGDWLPISLRVQGLIWVALQAIMVTGVMVLSPVLAAELTDYDEKLTGQRREGTYYATWGLLDNIVSGAASALIPLFLLMGRSASDPNGPLGVRAVVILGGVLMLAAFVIFTRYPLRQGIAGAGAPAEGG
jgi:GPH family glycoside/pentoside/hexuronide:cation symporter